jgi:hypothetical protein
MHLSRISCFKTECLYALSHTISQLSMLATNFTIIHGTVSVVHHVLH